MNASSATPAKGPLWSALVGAVIHTLLWIGLVVWLATVVQLWVPVFAEYRLVLPALTQQVLIWSQFITGYPVVCAIGLLLGVIDGLVLYSLDKPASYRVLREVWSGLVVGSAFAILAYSALALTMPVLALVAASDQGIMK